VYWIKIRNLSNNEVKQIEFETKEERDLYKQYHIVFHGWDKPQRWVHEKHLKEEDKALIKNTQVKKGQDGKNHTWYLIRPEFNFIKEAENEIDQWQLLREKRDFMLSSTDWTQLADSPLDTKIRQMYRDYRQFLRNLTLNYTDKSIEKHKVFTFDEWRDFFKR